MKKIKELYIYIYIYISLSSLILTNSILSSDLDTEVKEAKKDAYLKKAAYYNTNKTANAVNSYVSAATAVVGALLLIWRPLSYGSRYGSSKNFKLVNQKDITANFASIVGNNKVKASFQEVINFIKNPEAFTKKGVTAPRGILLWGSPGNGKTMLAKALAKECGCNFIETSATQLTIQQYVGTGAARIRELFALARKHTPCIVFIDEFDAVATDRSKATRGFENESINELLTQLDGFSETKKPGLWASIKNLLGFKPNPNEGKVIVIAATNLPDILDEAGTRPGRFDRKIEVKNPDLKNRITLLKLALNKLEFKKTLTEEHYRECGRITEGFSNADIAIGVGEEVGRYALRKELEEITMDMVEKIIKEMKKRKEKTSGKTSSLSKEAWNMYI